jgi:alkylation response protein AidB-like acyl-CoA dehydrogenase
MTAMTQPALESRPPASAPESIPPPAIAHQPAPASEPGARLVALAESLAADFATRAAEHDREATYAFENIDALRRHGYFAAPVPAELGGMGVGSVHDLIVASSRLARGDAATTIGLNMHLSVVLNILRRWRVATAQGDEARAAGYARSLEGIARGEVILAAAISEPGQDLTRPGTTATRTATGWRIDGRKIFCTMVPAATALVVAVTFADLDGSELYGYVQIPRGAPGVIVHDDWDALGMRASGSNSVTLDGVELPETALRGGFPAGRLTVEFMDRNLASGALHAAASVGIAEAAHLATVEGLARRGGAADRAHARMVAAANAIDLLAMRASFQQAGRVVDDYHADHPTTDGTLAEMAAAFAEVQAAKAFVNEASVRIVDRCLALSGGAGYMSAHPLSRAYRDVRAGAFMHPLGANRAYDFVGQVALGARPTLD